MTEPHRRDLPRRHLDAATASVERALLARAKALETGSDDPGYGKSELTDGTVVWDSTVKAAYVPPPQVMMLAAEFRALADELHYW